MKLNLLLVAEFVAYPRYSLAEAFCACVELLDPEFVLGSIVSTGRDCGRACRLSVASWDLSGLASLR